MTPERETGSRTESALPELVEIVRRLRAEDGCPWDRVQTHESLKAPCIEEAAEVVCGINILSETGRPENLKEELGDLLLQVVMHARIAEEEGLFTIEDVIQGISDKMIRRHPHVFGSVQADTPEAALASWNASKQKEKAGKEWVDAYLAKALTESKNLLDTARKRKNLPEIPQQGI